MQVVDCSLQRHGAAILAILNEAILHSTALYDYQPRSQDSMIEWFAEKQRGNFPVVGVEEHGELLGFASYGAFRRFPAYKYTVEHSLYVRRDARGRGLGKQLLGRLVELASARELHVMIAGIDAANSVSIALHEQLGFARVGLIRECGFKFGRWLDLAFYQRTLHTPAAPVDG